ncbi:UDP-N-acetylglucosamine 2-epimerase [Metabacillus elymi]|uniref:UDP-N-acetylglucosamine 2-epimerase (Hydrolyzing) n=1 Tax=Metabacillus elymi TaxID=2745198 RepID=A0ABX6S9K9_9BACI|nr:UDP-N-acetylglucosamine 2-epimerase [Metabacillus sp. KUDC1714]QNF28481.1 UDP-N-acetylglucosamine 2-epimerase (hydrolyzing) [Metabacillus sp. KUDC1714]
MTVKVKRITVVTGTRAEYGIYTPILQKFHDDPHFDVNLLVTGMHLSPLYGMTIDEIKKDGFHIGATVDMLLQGDTGANMAKSIGIGILGMSQAFENLNPDFIFVLGDRGEMLAAAIAGAYMNIPVVHFHGGEVTGSIDESVRHSISKMAHLHFVSTENNAKRLEKMGEEKWRIHCVGAPRIETIINTRLPSLDLVKNKYRLSGVKDYYLFVYHPVTTEIFSIEEQVSTVLEVLLNEKKDIICILPNSDAGTNQIMTVYKKYEDNINLQLVTNFEHLDYLAILKNAAALIGNSSSGIIEAASFHLPVINIGSRQNGREISENTINILPNKEELEKALKRIRSATFKNRLNFISNIYGDGNTSERVLNVLRHVSINNRLLQKKLTY